MKASIIFVSILALMAACGLVLAGVVINEIELNPPANEPFAAEWVELFNQGPDDVDIGGWQLVILSSVPGEIGSSYPWSGRITVPQGTVLNAGGYRVLSGDPRWDHGSNATAVLYNLTGEEIDKTPLREDSKADGSTWSRYPNGMDSWAYIPSTKGSENKLLYDR